jgi:hypothetical protein
MISGIRVSPGFGRPTPKTSFGKLNGSWIAQIRSCASDGRMRAGSPTATQPIGAVASSGRLVRRCTVALIRTSARAPMMTPLNTREPVARTARAYGFERAPAHEARDDIGADRERQLHPHQRSGRDGVRMKLPARPRAARSRSDEHRRRPLGDVVPGHEVRRFHGQAHAPDLPWPGAVAAVLLVEEHPPTQHGARHSAQLVDPTQRSARRRRPHQTQDLTVRG